MKLSLTLVFALALFCAMPAPSQTAVLPPPLRDEPLTVPSIPYPSEAKAARIQGIVHLQINVDPTGHVTEVHAIDGPIPLRQAAVDAYTKATYRPLIKDGHPTPALITTSVNFTLNELPPDTDLLVNRQFQPLHTRCQQLSLDHAPDALDTCRQAVDMARRFTPEAELEARATAYNDVVLLLIAPGKTSPALPEAALLADQTIGLVSNSGPHTPAVAIAHITRAEVRSLQGDLAGTEADCKLAEESLTTLLHDEAEVERAANYRNQLRETLLLHAVVLERDHHPVEARRLRNRAKYI